MMDFLLSPEDSLIMDNGIRVLITTVPIEGTIKSKEDIHEILFFGLCASRNSAIFLASSSELICSGAFFGA
jgi:hypothetical protein